ncbi:MAG: hypothetical protein FJ272_08560 [Planctomycetes bacterium]|nr:hypothetical protein [Planctomycetota bacterium]
MFGVKNDGAVLGQSVSEATLRQVANTLVDNIDPRVYPSVDRVTVDGKDVIVVSVVSSPHKPHTAFGRPYQRVASASKQMTRPEYERLLLARRRQWFDAEVCPDMTPKHLSADKVRWFLRQARAARNLDVNLRTPVTEALRKLKLLVDDGFTHSAALLFAKDPQWHLLSSEVRCGRFKGTDAAAPFIDMKVLRGSVIDQVNDAERFVLNNIRREAWIVPGRIAREERWEYPPEAVREAITNAIVHRDYRSTANVQVRIFDDRLEVWNPGRLPPGLTAQMLKGKHESLPSNPLLAGMFFLIGYVEQWGTGTNKIVEQCRTNGNPDPEFEDTGTSVVVTFRPPPGHAPAPAPLPEGLNEKEKRAMEYVRAKGSITNKTYQELNKVGHTTAAKALSGIVGKGLLRREGKGRAARYVLARPGRPSSVGRRLG